MCFLFCTLGVLENGIEDFQNGEEIFEAIGEVLLQLDDSKTESDIKFVYFFVVCSLSLLDRVMRMILQKFMR